MVALRLPVWAPVAPRQRPFSGRSHVCLLAPLNGGFGENWLVRLKVCNWPRAAVRIADPARRNRPLQADVLLVADRAASAAKAATKTVPIVSPTVQDPVELGLVEVWDDPAVT